MSKKIQVDRLNQEILELNNENGDYSLRWPVVIGDAAIVTGPYTGVKGLRVYGGPTDPISDVPVYMDFSHHQRHEGETYRVQYVDASLDTGTVKFAFVVPTYGTIIRAPHMLIHCDVYNGAAKVDLYEGATYTGGSAMTTYNVNRNSANVAGGSAYYGVTSTSGTLLPFSFYSGTGTRSAGSTRGSDEIELKVQTTYRIDMTGQAAGTDAILILEWYEDMGI